MFSYISALPSAMNCWNGVFRAVIGGHFRLQCVGISSQSLTPGFVLVGRDPPTLRANRKQVRRVPGYSSRPRALCLPPTHTGTTVPRPCFSYPRPYVRPTLLTTMMRWKSLRNDAASGFQTALDIFERAGTTA